MSTCRVLNATCLTCGRPVEGGRNVQRCARCTCSPLAARVVLRDALRLAQQSREMVCRRREQAGTWAVEGDREPERVAGHDSIHADRYQRIAELLARALREMGDARLIASALDGYALAKMLLGDFDYDTVCDMARALVAKVEGQNG